MEKNISIMSWIRQMFFRLPISNRTFWLMIGGFSLVLLIAQPYPNIARWIACLLACIAVTSNDIPQDFGTFIASNKKRPWWFMWVWISVIFLATTLFSWYFYNGDVSHQRLASKGFDQTPASFNFFQLAAPLVLLILTRYRFPVSTSFMVLGCFAATASSFGKVIMKSLTGYLLAFAIGFIVWTLFGKLMKKKFSEEPHPGWVIAQWLSTGALWSIWVMQDISNIAVYIPRQLSIFEYSLFAVTILGGLAFLFKNGGNQIQERVNNKSDVSDLRHATMVDLTYGAILYYFKILNNTPMSTTWTFFGLLAGRELGKKLVNVNGDRSFKKVALDIKEEFFSMSLGLVVSMILAILANDNLRQQVFSWIWQ